MRAEELPCAEGEVYEIKSCFFSCTDHKKTLSDKNHEEKNSVGNE